MSIDQDAETIFNYMRLNMDIHPAEVMIAHGCQDARVVEHAAQLMLDGYGSWIVMTGGYGKVTKHSNDKTEAEIFRDIAIEMGVPAERILAETASTNTGANLMNTLEILRERTISPRSILSVCKPYVE